MEFLGSNSSWWQPCPPGTYNNETGKSDVSQCLECDEGYYCEGYGRTSPLDLCEEGLCHVFIRSC